MDENVTTVHQTQAMSSAIIMNLIDRYPNLREITCPPSVYERTSKTYIDALNQLDIEVKKDYNWGAKSQSNGEEFEVLRLSDEGLSAKEISEKLEIKLNRVYYLLRKTGNHFDNRKRKHNHDDVKALKSQGLSAKEISQKLDIPVRSVYYILNNK